MKLLRLALPCIEAQARAYRMEHLIVAAGWIIMQHQIDLVRETMALTSRQDLDKIRLKAAELERYVRRNQRQGLILAEFVQKRRLWPGVVTKLLILMR